MGYLWRIGITLLYNVKGAHELYKIPRMPSALCTKDANDAKRLRYLFIPGRQPK
jgi:hypothetical protein